MANTKGIRAGRAFVELGVSDKLTAGLRRAQKRLSAFGSGLRSIGTRITGFGAALAAPLAGSLKVFAAAGDQLDKMSKRTGVSVEALSELGFAAEQSGTNLETFEKGVRTMQRTVGDAEQGLSTAVDAFDALGLSVDQLQGLSPEQQFTLIADRLSQITDPTLRASAAMDVFGRAGTQLIPLLENGAKGMAELRDQAKSLGLTISTQSAADAAKLTDTLNILWRVVKNNAFAIGSALAPAIIEASNRITSIVVRTSNWIKQNQDLIATAFKVAAGVVFAGVALAAFGAAVSAVASVVGGLATVVSGIGAAFGIIGSAVLAILSPVGLAVSAIIALGATILTATDIGAEALQWLGDRFRSLKGTVFKVIGGITDALKAGDISLAAKVLWLGLKLAWQTGVNALQEIWANLWAEVRIAGIEVWSQIIGAFREFRQFLESAFPNLTAAIVETWSSMVFALRSTWANFQKWLTDQIIKIWGFFDKDINVQGMLDLNSQELQADLQNIEADHTARVAEAIRKQQRSPEEIAAEHALENAEAEARKLNSFAGVVADRNQSITDAANELKNAQAELNAATELAKSKAAESTDDPALAKRTIADPLKGLEDRFKNIGKTIEDKISVVGTFNASALFGIGTQSAAEQTAKATALTAANTAALLSHAKRTRLAFGG